MQRAEQPTFEVTGHFAIAGRGGVVVGHVRGGVFRCGMRVAGQPGFPALTIAGVEFVDNLTARSCEIGFIFEERPLIDVLRAQFPVGSVLSAPVHACSGGAT